MKLPYEITAPLIVVCGHFGSGKTNVSVALALALKKAGKDVTLIDLDIINPYFRAADAEALMKANGIRCINPMFANTNVDVPTIGPEVASVFIEAKNEGKIAIFDVGGDNGAAALGKYQKDFLEIGYNMLGVVSRYRPLTETPELAAEGLREIEYYSRLSFTHIVNNSNIGNETTKEYVADSFPYAEEISRLTSLPVAFTSVVNAPFTDELKKEYPEQNIFTINDTTKKLF